MRGCAVPQEALVGVHVQVAAVARHLVQGVMKIARQLPQTLHASGLQSRLNSMLLQIVHVAGLTNVV